MKNINNFMRIMLSVAIISCSALPVNAAPLNDSNISADPTMDSSVIGGWDEDTGYFKNPEAYNRATSNAITVYSTAKHTGKKERKDTTASTYYRAHGWTTWVGVNHYTRAQMKDGSTVLKDSGRVWGVGGTEAISPWFACNNATCGSARTYYGR